jgi:hypothetical protein
MCLAVVGRRHPPRRRPNPQYQKRPDGAALAWPAEGKRWDRTGGSLTRLNAHHHDRLSLFLGDATNSTEIGAILLASMGLGIASQ